MDDIVKLNVGGREFLVGQSTLTLKSLYFATLLNGDFSHQLINDHIFIDADPDMFGHILRYLRRLEYPLFYKNGEFEYSVYDQLRVEAEFFGLERLEKWIWNKEFQNVVVVERHTREILEFVDDDVTRLELGSFLELYNKAHDPDPLPANVKLEFLSQKAGTKAVWQCPRGIVVHHTANRCGRQCQKCDNYGETRAAPCMAHYRTFAKTIVFFDRLKEK
ncbi:hypothetical protein HDU87_000785 [Geranomyces variabilis]|uniref:BTB domain-containing protein n=1 Tax=Geranomyces variabilis TaxID=109894 RepID=A0AAD5TNB6_9FUNG|nr:hypothetical protein HDU87_000785 [Geranomyces variabilis]